MLGLIETKSVDETLDRHLAKLIEDRERARQEKDFVKADQLREQLLAAGVLLEDTAEGVRWKIRN